MWGVWTAMNLPSTRPTLPLRPRRQSPISNLLSPFSNLFSPITTYQLPITLSSPLWYHSSSMDEQALIHEAQDGGLDAFNRLVLEYQTIVYNLAYRIMGDGDSANDATQEALISAYKNLKYYRGG